MAGREVYEDMSSSQEREASFQVKIRKLRKELEETECMRKEELERREEARRSKGSDEHVREIRKPGDQTAGADKEGNGENQRQEELGRERDESESRRAEERWKAIFESEVEKEVGRRMRARDTSKDMTEMDEPASNPQQQEQHKEPRRQDRHHQPEGRRNMGHPCERRGVSHDTEAGEARGRTRQMFLSKNAAERRSQSQEVGRWEAGGRGPQIEPTAEDGYWRQMGQEHGEGWEGRGGGPITEPSAEGGYWGGRRGGPEHGGWIQGGEGKRQHRDRAAEEDWWFSDEKGRGAWTRQMAEDGYWGTTRGRANEKRRWADKEVAPGWGRRERFGGEGWKRGETGADGGPGPSSYFREPEPSSWAQVMDMGMVMWGVIRADGGVPPWGSVKERAMSSLCSERFFMNRKGEGDLMRFSDLDMTMYSRTEKSGKRRSEGGTALPDRVEATLGVILYMARLATDGHTKMGRDALGRVESQWGKPFHSVKEGVNHFFVTNRRVVESEYFQEEFVTRFNMDLAELGEEVRTQALRLKRRGNTWPTAEEAGPLPVPELKATLAWLDLAQNT